MPVVAARTQMPASRSVTATASHAASSSGVHVVPRLRVPLRLSRGGTTKSSWAGTHQQKVQSETKGRCISSFTHMGRAWRAAGSASAMTGSHHRVGVHGKGTRNGRGGHCSSEARTRRSWSIMTDLCEVVITAPEAPDPDWLLDLTRQLVAEGLRERP